MILKPFKEMSDLPSEQLVLQRPGEFRRLRGPRGLRGPEKKSAKSEVHGMNLIKVRGMNFYKSPRNPRSAE